MNEFSEISSPGRRVVTGINESGKSIIVTDGSVPENATWFHPESVAQGGDLWIEKNVPVDLTNQSDPMTDYTLQDWPPPGGVIVRMATWQPGFSFPMHRSNTIDFLTIFSGQVELILEDGSTILQSGDTVIQRGTKHAWRVVGNEPCTLWAVLIDATSPDTEDNT